MSKMIEPIIVDPKYYEQGKKYLKPWEWAYKDKYGFWRNKSKSCILIHKLLFIYGRRLPKFISHRMIRWN